MAPKLRLAGAAAAAEATATTTDAYKNSNSKKKRGSGKIYIVLKTLVAKNNIYKGLNVNWFLLLTVIL